jgi:hypothetical protein
MRNRPGEDVAPRRVRTVTAQFWHDGERAGRLAQVRWPSTTWRKMLAARACCTSDQATVSYQHAGASSSTRCFGRFGSRHSRSCR